MRFSVKVTAGAKKTRLIGFHGSALKISVQSPATDGKANKALTEFLADILGVTKSCVSIISGQTNPHKIVAVSGITAEDALKKLTAQNNA